MNEIYPWVFRAITWPEIILVLSASIIALRDFLKISILGAGRGHRNDFSLIGLTNREPNPLKTSTCLVYQIILQNIQSVSDFSRLDGIHLYNKLIFLLKQIIYQLCRYLYLVRIISSEKKALFKDGLRSERRNF